jgi:hypothetical protein
MITNDNGINAYQVMYYDYGRHGHSSYKHKIWTLCTYLQNLFMLYVLTYRTEPSGFDANLGKAKQMVDSFQFTN